MMTKKKSKLEPGVFYRVERGIENASGRRFEAGTVVAVEDLSEHFSDTQIIHWRSTGTLVVVDAPASSEADEAGEE